MDIFHSSCRANTVEPVSRLELPKESANRDGVIQVWIVPFALLRKYTALSHLLSADERIRVSRLRGTKRARDYIMTRLILRSILASQMNCMPLDVDIQYPRNGKPFVMDGPEFNISHCEKLLVVAVADCDFIGQIGVDAETRVTDPSYLRLAEKCFTQSERSQLATYKPGISQQNAFTRGWTRKEAVVKALGIGLQAPLNCFDVSLKSAEGDDQFELSTARHTMLLGSRLKGASLQDCELYDLGSFLDCELSLAIVNEAVEGGVVRNSEVRVHKADENHISILTGFGHG